MLPRLRRMIHVILVFLVSIAPVSVAGFIIWLRKKRQDKSIAIFHPYCNAGGGGERVLWSLIQAIQSNHSDFQVVIYTGDCDVSCDQILSKVKSSFKINLVSKPHFIFLKSRTLVEAKWYPFFTLAGQSLGSVILALEAVCKFTPHYFIDTMGYAFSYPIFRVASGSKVACYTHYPTISEDMLRTVDSSAASFNNRPFIASSSILTFCKLLYYRLFARLYAFVGRFSSLVLVNSSWTRQHINSIWAVPERTHLLFPPCDTRAFLSLPLHRNQDNRYTVVSVAQFRPEKNHQLQLRSFERFINSLPLNERQLCKLVLVGGCRDDSDRSRVQQLSNLAQSLHIADKVVFELNITFDRLLQIVQSATIGLHTMTNEHFGIGVVELMAGGVITIAHKSGGPKMDIISHGETGFLAATEDEYADIMLQVATKMSPSHLNSMRQAARKSVERFSHETFQTQVTQHLAHFI